jgi:hypothetical protein
MSRIVTAPQHGSRPDRSAHHGRGRSPRGARVIRESLVILLGALLYFFVRGLMDSQTSLAIAHAHDVIALETALGIFHEPWLQGEIIPHGWLVTLLNRIYIFGHWPVIVGTLTWLVWKHPAQFARYRSALLISGAIGLFFFILFPTAPPRFLTDKGFVDTVTLHSHAYRVLQPPSFTNPYAAMPSLHVGWNLLMGIAIVRCASTRWAKAFGYLMPLVMWMATVLTANHYIIDGVVGSAVALTGLGIAIWLERRHATRRSTHDVPATPPSRSIGQGWSHRPAA